MTDCVGAPIVTTEAALLGAVLLWPDSLDRVPAELATSDFQGREHRAIWAAIQRRASAGKSIDPHSIVADLAPAAADALQAALAEAATAAHVEHHAAAILAAGVRRQLAVGLDALAKEARATDPPEAGRTAADLLADSTTLIESAEARLTGARQIVGLTAAEGLGEVLAEASAAARGEARVVETPFWFLNRTTGGLRPGELTILAARPSMGKTALAAQLAAHAAAGGAHVVLVSLEMRAVRLWARLAAGASGISGIRTRAGALSAEEHRDLVRACNELDQRLGNRLLILDRCSSDVRAIVATLRRLRRQGRCSLAILDFIQRTTTAGRFANRNAELEETSRRLADFARAELVPLVVCSQLSRGAEGSTPSLGHLRDCGSIEADADNVLFLHRDPSDPQYNRELIVGKCRDGRVGAFPVMLDKTRLTFHELARCEAPSTM